MKKTLAIALAIVFVLAFAVPAFAQSMVHVVQEQYVDAQIDIERQHGHLCNTGAQLKYSVQGSAAEFMATRTISQERGLITVSNDDAAWVAGATPLTVTSVIELCAPAKTLYGTTAYVYDDATGEWNTTATGSGVVDPYLGYGLYGWADAYAVGATVYESLTDAVIVEAFGGSVWDYLEASAGARADAYAALQYTHHSLTALTDQIWAVQVQSDPGFSGNLEQDWEAAYGGWNGVWDAAFDLPAAYPGAPNQWGFVADDDYAYGVEVGEDFVGNYFTMDQHARVSQGHLYRYIDISSPWSHAFVSEYAEVTGKADVQEAFVMGNLDIGAEMTTDWWDLF